MILPSLLRNILRSAIADIAGRNLPRYLAADTLNGIIHGFIGLAHRGCNLAAATAVQIQIQNPDLQIGKLTAHSIQQRRSLFPVDQQILGV